MTRQRRFAAKVLYERLCMKRRLDAVLGVAFFYQTVDDQFSLVGVLEPGANDIGYVKISMPIKRTSRGGGVIGRCFCRDREIVSAKPSEPLGSAVDDLAEPFLLE
jgi:hypothetical protein